MAQRNLIQRAWEQLVRESAPQLSDGTTVEEVHVHRGHFNRSLLGGRFPPALEVRQKGGERQSQSQATEPEPEPETTNHLASQPASQPVSQSASHMLTWSSLCVQERIFLAFRSKNREVVTFRASPPRFSVSFVTQSFVPCLFASSPLILPLFLCISVFGARSLARSLNLSARR